jgi:lipopolysaccharide/colanic/teichoic acid biosynthesis glycosyltransferase
MESAENIFMLESPIQTTNSRGNQINPDENFYRSGFCKHLYNEMLRAQRSKSPLSILILTVEGKTDHTAINMDELFSLLKKRTRDIDICGLINYKTIGVILPYTNEEGAKNACAKIVNEGKSQVYFVGIYTYPDHIFESLTQRGSIQSNKLLFASNELIGNVWIKLLIKRCIDVIGSIVCLIIFMPVMIITALAIRITSPGPVIYRQRRLGRAGVPFTMYKFRSMRQDTDDKIHREYIRAFMSGNGEKVNNGDENRPLYKIKCDPRVTNVGRFIRKYSIDELPQLFNVLKGEMSLVGPRPALAYEAEKYQPWHLRRILEAKPGLTGLWQVTGRSKTKWDDSVRLDIRYIKKLSLRYDLQILLRTVREVLRGTGGL